MFDVIARGLCSSKIEKKSKRTVYLRGEYTRTYVCYIKRSSTKSTEREEEEGGDKVGLIGLFFFSSSFVVLVVRY